MTFHTQLEWLLKLHISRQAIADRAGTDRTTVGRWLSNATIPTEEHRRRVEQFFREVMPYVALRSPAVLPAECFEYLCSRRESYPPGHVQLALANLSAALINSRPNFLVDEAMSLPSNLATKKACALTVIPMNLCSMAEAHIFRADCNPVRAYVILIDQALEGATYRSVLATELGHMLDDMQLPPHPDVPARSFLETIRQTPRTASETQK